MSPGPTPSERLFRGTGEAYEDEVPLPEPPPWRRPPAGTGARPRRPYLIGDDQVDVVNAALRLRRPLLVTGNPGTGKSSLAYAIADELGLQATHIGRTLRNIPPAAVYRIARRPVPLQANPVPAITMIRERV